jgi:hypothetical protein
VQDKDSIFSYYAQPGPMTDLASLTGDLNGLPRDVPGLCKLVQNLYLHIFWAERYGYPVPIQRQGEVQVRPAATKLALTLARNPGLLAAPRTPAEKQISNCRDYSTLLVAFLRYLGIPARARCGFARYFTSEQVVDHWVVEYWSASEARWVWVDAQLDDFQAEKLKLTFNPLDMEPGYFLPGGLAWQMCRSGEADPDHFGIFDMHGWAFIRGNVLRDLASLNKMELLPWDLWGLMLKRDEEMTEKDNALADRAAAAALTVDEDFAGMRQLYQDEVQLRVPDVIFSWVNNGMQQVDLRELKT